MSSPSSSSTHEGRGGRDTAPGHVAARGPLSREQPSDPAHREGTARVPANWLQSSLQRTPGSRQHRVGPGRSARDVSTASRAVPELAPAHSAPRGCSRVSRLPAARHFRRSRRVGAPSLPAATGVDGGWRQARSAVPSPLPSLPVPPWAAARRGDSRAGLGVSAGRRGGLRRRTPAVRASRHPARRRHGHEADTAHLLRPHAARGGLGLQRHHAVRLLSDQRLQR